MMNIEQTVDFHLRSTLFTMRRLYNVLAAEIGLTQGISYTLINIRKEGVPATKIAPMMGMTSSSLTRLLKTMEIDGLIYRQPDTEDKRIVRIFLTEEGLSLREKVKSVIVCFNEKLFKKINENDWEAFIRVSNTIKNQVSEEMNALQRK